MHEKEREIKRNGGGIHNDYKWLEESYTNTPHT